MTYREYIKRGIAHTFQIRIYSVQCQSLEEFHPGDALRSGTADMIFDYGGDVPDFYSCGRDWDILSACGVYEHDGFFTIVEAHMIMMLKNGDLHDIRRIETDPYSSITSSGSAVMPNSSSKVPASA